MKDQDYILMCDKTLEAIKLKFKTTNGRERGPERSRLSAFKIDIMRLRSVYIRRLQNSASQKSSAT